MLLHSPDLLGPTLSIAMVLLAALSKGSHDHAEWLLALDSSSLPHSGHRLIASFVGPWEVLSKRIYCVLCARGYKTQ